MNALALPWLSDYRKYAPVILRVTIGVLFVGYGYSKLFTNEPGIEGFAGMLNGLNIPGGVAMAYLVGIVEFFGGILLILGLFTRVIGLALAVIMVVAIFTVHLPNGVTGGDGWGLRFAVMGGALALTLLGGGKMGVDDALGWDTD